MILAIDVDYREDNKAVVAGVLFEKWEDQSPHNIITALYITSIGIAQVKAKEHIQQMHGKYRFPTLLKLVDSSCRF